MKKIIAFAGSNSKESINKKLAVYAANRVDQVEVQVLDLNDFSLPIYGIDEEKENGIPLSAIAFLEHLHNADGIVLSLAEHNGNFSTAFKNLFDWMSRIQKNFWNQVPMLLLSTSPGANGAKSVLGIAKNGFPHMGGNIVADFSLPTFNNNFVEGQLVDASLQEQLDAALLEFKKHL